MSITESRPQRWETLRNQHPQLNEGFDRTVSLIGDISPAFVPDRSPAVCVDEGLEGRFRLAGVGTLLPKEHAGDILAHMRKAGANAVKSHEECGAAAKANPENPEKHSRAVAIRLAGEAGLPYHGHITQLNRPDGYHHALGTILDFTGRFDSSKVDGLPPVFTVSGLYVGEDVALDEAALTTGIAMGDNGFGSLFTKEDPFRLVTVLDPHRDIFDPQRLQPLVDVHNGRVVVDVFTPSKSLLSRAER